MQPIKTRGTNNMQQNKQIKLLIIKNNWQDRVSSGYKMSGGVTLNNSWYVVEYLKTKYINFVFNKAYCVITSYFDGYATWHF